MQDRSFFTGFFLSVAGHLALAAGIWASLGPLYNKFAEPVVYSVSIEGGKSLGGITQLPEPNKKTEAAPPKNVSAPEPEAVPEKAPEPKPEVKLPPKVEPKKEPEKKKEVEKPKKAEVKKEPAKPVKKVEPPKKKPEPENVEKKYQQALQRYVGESTDAGGRGFGAGKLGGSSMGGGKVVPPEVLRYRKILHDAIKSGWRWNDTNAALIAQVTFEITPSGEVRAAKVVQGSGNSLYDESAIRAVYKASPVPAPPPSVYLEYFKYVRMTFDPRE